MGLDGKKGPGPNSFWVHNEIAWIIYSGSKKKTKMGPYYQTSRAQPNKHGKAHDRVIL